MFLPDFFTANIIFCLHSVTDERTDYFHSISSGEFLALLEWIDKFDYKVVELNELVNATNKDKRLCSFTFDDGFSNTIHSIFLIKNKYSVKSTLFVCPELIEQGDPYLSYEEISSLLLSDYIEIGSHGKNHVDFTTLSEDLLIENLESSQKILANKFNRSVASVAYPFGKHDEKTRLHASCFYSNAFSVHLGPPSLYSIKRFDINKESINFATMNNYYFGVKWNIKLALL